MCEVADHAVPLSTLSPIEATVYVNTASISCMYTERSLCHTALSMGRADAYCACMHDYPRTPGTAAELGRDAGKPYAKDQMNHLCQVYTSTASLPVRSITVIVVALLLRRLSELLLPSCVRLRGVDVREDEVKDLRVPRYRFAFDAFFNVL